METGRNAAEKISRQTYLRPETRQNLGKWEHVPGNLFSGRADWRGSAGKRADDLREQSGMELKGHSVHGQWDSRVLGREWKGSLF